MTHTALKTQYEKHVLKTQYQKHSIKKHNPKNTILNIHTQH